MNEPKDYSAFNKAHKIFVHSDHVYDDHPEPVSSRYEEAVLAVPELARRKLYEDCGDLLEDGYHNASGDRLTQLLNWASLQKYFWMYLYGNGMCSAAMLGVQANYLNLFEARLSYRHDGMKPWRRGGKHGARILKPKLGSLDDVEAQIVH